MGDLTVIGNRDNWQICRLNPRASDIVMPRSRVFEATCLVNATPIRGQYQRYELKNRWVKSNLFKSLVLTSRPLAPICFACNQADETAPIQTFATRDQLQWHNQKRCLYNKSMSVPQRLKKSESKYIVEMFLFSAHLAQVSHFVQIMSDNFRLAVIVMWCQSCWLKAWRRVYRKSLLMLSKKKKIDRNYYYRLCLTGAI